MTKPLVTSSLDVAVIQASFTEKGPVKIWDVYTAQTFSALSSIELKYLCQMHLHLASPHPHLHPQVRSNASMSVRHSDVVLYVVRRSFHTMFRNWVLLSACNPSHVFFQPPLNLHSKSAGRVHARFPDIISLMQIYLPLLIQ